MLNAVDDLSGELVRLLFSNDVVNEARGYCRKARQKPA